MFKMVIDSDNIDYGKRRNLLHLVAPYFKYEERREVTRRSEKLFHRFEAKSDIWTSVESDDFDVAYNMVKFQIILNRNKTK